jgi:hypothetical protein
MRLVWIWWSYVLWAIGVLTCCSCKKRAEDIIGDRSWCKGRSYSNSYSRSQWIFKWSTFPFSEYLNFCFDEANRGWTQVQIYKTVSDTTWGCHLGETSTEKRVWNWVGNTCCVFNRKAKSETTSFQSTKWRGSRSIWLPSRSPYVRVRAMVCISQMLFHLYVWVAFMNFVA